MNNGCHGDVLAFVADGMSPEIAGGVVLGEISEDDAHDLMKSESWHLNQ